MELDDGHFVEMEIAECAFTFFIEFRSFSEGTAISSKSQNMNPTTFNAN